LYQNQTIDLVSTKPAPLYAGEVSWNIKSCRLRKKQRPIIQPSLFQEKPLSLYKFHSSFQIVELPTQNKIENTS